MNVSWFSTGASSAVATKLVIDEIEKIFYIHINDQHSDSMRFVKDCEQWFGKKIEIMQSDYKFVNDVVLSTRYVNGVAGAACTRILKKRVRVDWEKKHKSEDLTYIWGMDCNESERLERLKSSMPDQKHRCPLIEKSISKEHAHQILKASGIKRPAMYDLGYLNNNCIGCVKGGAGYWQKIKKDFPDVFDSRAKMERDVGRSCLKEYFLDELPENYGRDQKPIVDDCGIFCELEAL